LDVNNTTAADTKSKIYYLQVFPRSNTNTFTTDATTSADFLREIEATPNKAIGNLLLSDSATKKRKAAEDLAAAKAKKIKGSARDGDAAAAVDSEATMTEAEIQYQIDQLDREDKMAKFQEKLRMGKEAAKKA